MEGDWSGIHLGCIFAYPGFLIPPEKRGGRRRRKRGKNRGQCRGGQSLRRDRKNQCLSSDTCWTGRVVRSGGD